MPSSKGKIILGIDPGTSILGYGIISLNRNEIELLSMGIVKLAQIADHYQRLQTIYTRVTKIIEQYDPSEVAIEAPFYGKNIQSMLKLGRAQGVAIAAALQFNLPVFEYAPKKIKQSITGNGNASKEQIASMLHHHITYDNNPKFLDATDGLAIAICHYIQSSRAVIHKEASYKNWKDFIRNNPSKVSGK